MTTRDYAICLVLAILLLVSCSPTRHLAPNEHLLVEVELEGATHVQPEAIEALYRQTPNIKIPLLNFYPQLEVYYFGKIFYRPQKIQERINSVQQKYQERIKKAAGDSAKVARLVEKRNNKVENLQTTLKQGNFFMRKVGEPPAIYDSALTKKTVEQIDIFLNSKGYFRNQTTYNERFRKKRAYLKYQITEGPAYVYDQVKYQIADSAIRNLVLDTRAESLIKDGKVYDESELEAERDRLTLLMRNNGYFYFNKRFIYFEVDTSFGGQTVRPVTYIENPSDTTQHRRYTLRNVFFVEDASVSRFGIARDTLTYNGVKFLSFDHKFRPKALYRKVRIFPGQLYNYDRTLRTQRQLTDLGVFRFANISYTPVIDTGRYELNAYITAHPTDRFQLSNQLGISLREQLPGPFLNLRLFMRNVTGGAELLEFGVRGGFEGVYSRTTEKGEYSKEIGGNVALTVPRFFLPIASYDFFARNAPRTRFNIGYTYIDRPDYERTNAEFSMQYLWRNRNYQQFMLSPFEINILDTRRLDPEFRDYLVSISQGGSLLRSFESNFVSAMNFTYLYNDNDLAQTKNAHYFRGFVELGGLFKSLTENLFLPNLNRFQYTKFEGDYRRYLPQAPERMLVYRLHAGVALPYGTVKAVPYEEYFFAGGGSSVRAWRPRRLGPGTYNPDSLNAQGNLVDLDPEQPGEVIMEANLEFRFPVFGFIKGALFVDAGNVWSLSPDITSARPGSEFTSNFYRQLGVATGLGIRLDFTFLIIRFDIGTQVYDPSYAPARSGEARPDKPQGYVLDKFNLSRDQTTINFGIGYPF